jgi:uncharacterized protein
LVVEESAMQCWIRTSLLAAVAALPCITALAGPFEDGAAANKRGSYAEAIAIWRPLAEEGDAKAQFALAVMYDMGRGVPQSRAESVKWWRRAAERGHAGAQFALASIYLEGKGVKQDSAEAAKWLQRAAEQGDAVSQLALAGAFSQGLGVQKDLVEAFKWATIAATQNLTREQGEKNQRILAAVMTPEQVAEANSRVAQWKPRKENNVK